MSYYLYSDASIKALGNNRVHNAYVGGMITDESGKILFSFFEKITDEKGFTCAHIDYAEAVALEFGLEHAVEMGIKDIKCFTDSKNCVDAINNFKYNVEEDIAKKNSQILRRLPISHKEKQTEKILDILSVSEDFFDRFDVQHIPRKKNQYADNMSNYLRVFEKGSKTEFILFSKMLKRSIMYAFEYDFIEEHKAHILDVSLHRAEQRKIKKSKSNI